MRRSVWGLLAMVVVAGYLGRDMLAPYAPDWAAPYLRATPGTPAEAQARSGGRKGAASGPIAVTVAEAKAGTLPLTRSTIGTIVPVRSTTLSTEISGTIGAIYVRDGQDVTKGQQLIKLDDRTILAQIVKDQAQMDKDQATLDDARSTYARTKHLVETGVTATQTGDDALTAVKVAEGTLAVDKAALDADRVQQSLGLLRAPFDGRLGAVQLSPGAYVSAGTAIVRITQMKPVWAEFSLSETDLPLLRQAETKGVLKARISSVAPGGVAPVTATVPVVFIDSQVAAGSATVTLRADVQNSDLAYWPGQTINVTVEAGQTAPLVLVPNVAVMPQQSGALVYVAGADGTAEARKVTVALREGDLAGISTGLKPGEKVVTEGQGQLHGGAKLKIMPAEGTAAPADKATAGTAEGTAAGGAIKS